MSQFTPAPAAQPQRHASGPTRPPQSRNGNGKRQGEDSDDRPSKRPEAEQQQQQQQGGGRGGMRGGRGGFGGGRGGGQQQQQRQPQQQQQQTPRQPQQQQQQQQQAAFMPSIPHPGQQQQQRPQSAAPFQGQGQQQQQRNGGGGGRGGRGGGQQNGGQRRPQQQQHQQSDAMDVSPEAPRSASSGPHVPAPTSAASSAPSSSPAPGAAVIESFKSDQTFRSLRLSALTQRALDEDFKYINMSVVQAACIPKVLAGADIVAKAKTGTGKTLAFLIPVIERILANRATLPPAVGGQRPIRALVISPTRELAQQIEDEATRLGKFHQIKLACVVGGLAINKDVRALQNGLDLLIATPGRLKDLMQNHGAIGQQLQSMVMLVLDEADRLLDMGFKPDLDCIFGMLPRANSRQTQLFSATFPADVAEMTSRALKPNHEIVNTVGDEDDQTHQHVVQESVVIPLAQQFEALYELIAQHKASNPKYKIIVFFTTARVASFCSRLFNQANCPTLELHSRLSQSKRTKTSEQFRDGSKMVLFSSDVSARGLDFPGVSLIIQIGLTAKDQYVHRLGRTARAGNEGHGIIMLAPFERRFLNTLTPDLPIVPLALPAGSVLAALANGQTPVYPASMQKGGFPHPIAYALSLVEDGSSGSSSDSAEDTLKGEAESAYRAWMGFYNGNLRTCGWDKAALVAQANAWSAMIGLREIPTIEAKTIGKMGLKGTPGLRIGQSSGGGGGGRGGNGGGRGGGQQGGGGGRGGYGGQGQGRPQSARY